MTGVYAIRCTVNGKVYIGSASVSFEKRWANHRWFLCNGRHANRYLQAAWKKHGEHAFVFEVLEECEPADCVAREQFWIDETRCTDRAIGYNIRLKAESNLGIKRSPEVCARISAMLRARPRRKETYVKIAAALRGRGYGPEVRANMSAGQKGKRHSEATKLKMGATRKGRKYSEAHRQAIRDGQLRRSTEQRAAKEVGQLRLFE